MVIIKACRTLTCRINKIGEFRITLSYNCRLGKQIYIKFWIQTTVLVAVAYDFGPSISMYIAVSKRIKNSPIRDLTTGLSHYTYIPQTIRNSSL